MFATKSEGSIRYLFQALIIYLLCSFMISYVYCYSGVFQPISVWLLDELLLSLVIDTQMTCTRYLQDVVGIFKIFVNGCL